MDEHIILDEPKIETLEGGDLVDHNLNDLSWWIQKHNGYADLEVLARLEVEAASNQKKDVLSGQAARKRWVKENIYYRTPTVIRSGLYFLYRYFWGAGFLDGKEGFYFHFLQAFWYRTLVEAKLYEVEKLAASKGLSSLDWSNKNRKL